MAAVVPSRTAFRPMTAAVTANLAATQADRAAPGNQARGHGLNAFSALRFARWRLHKYDGSISPIPVLRETRARRRGGGLHSASALTDTAAGLQRIPGMIPRRSSAWNAAFRVAYATIRIMDPLLRWTWFSVGLGITSRLTVRGRRTGRERSVLVGLIRVGGRWYVGHPNGEVAWTRNLLSSRSARVFPRPEAPVDVAAAPLDQGPERDAVIYATSEQQPFPANLLYRGARRHILSEGRYFRLEPR